MPGLGPWGPGSAYVVSRMRFAEEWQFALTANGVRKRANALVGDEGFLVDPRVERFAGCARVASSGL
ncbi:hypothetical protein GCM10010446_49490 [Streptomyces enissocaesilis]|uniref:Uncharacterized protein n=1 Tax=Streptomyces enissocaesilis TaxID=332589 RepID=A0ABP6K217_9ACTN